MDTKHPSAFASSSESACEQWCPNSPGAGSNTQRGRGLALEGRMLPRAQQEGLELKERKKKQKSQLEEQLALCCSAGGHQAWIHNKWLND